MKFLKKGFAFLLVFAVLISSIGVGVFATPADDDIVGLYITRDNENVGQGRDVTYTLAFKALKQDSFKLNSGQIVVQFDKDKYSVSVPEILAEAQQSDVAIQNGKVTIMPTPATGFSATNSGTLMMKLKFTVAANAEAATGVSPFTVTKAKAADAEDIDVKTYIDTVPTINILAADKITGTATATVTDKTIGTDVKDILPATVQVTTSEKNSAVVGTQVSVEWDTAEFNNKLLTEQTVTGTIKVTDPITVAENLKATAKVTLKPIAGTVPTDLKADLKQPKVAPSTAEEKLNAVKDILPTTLDLKQGDITDKVSVTWNDATTYPTTNAIGDKFTVKGNVNADSENGLFKFAATAVEAEVTIVTPEVEGGTITVDNAAKYGNATVKFTIPAAAGLKKDDEITASIYAQDGATKGIAATALETSAPIKVTEEETGKEYTNSIKFSSFDTLKLDTNNVFYVKVFVNGAPLLNGTGKDAKDYVESYVLPESNRRPNNGGGNSGGTVVVKKHDVKVTEGTNGTATVDKEAKVGDTVKVDVKPNEGYKVKEIIVKTADGKTVEVDQKNRTFVMPDGDVTVEVVYEEGTEEPTVSDGKFTDVPDTFWAAADIYTLKEAGIINGKSDKEFDPEGKVTRAEFTKMIVNLFGVKASQNTVAFTDCKADDWFTPFVAAAVEAGYVKGITDTEFAPDKTITREEACTILGRAYAKTSDKALNFTDASGISDFATAYVALLVDMGYVNGYEDGTFLPKNEITRAEAAKIIASAFRAAEKAKTEVTEDKTEAKDNADADVKADDKTDAKADDKTEVKADDKTDAKADAKTDAKADDGETPEK